MKQEMETIIATIESYRGECLSAYNEATKKRIATGEAQRRFEYLCDGDLLDSEMEADYESAANAHFDAMRQEWKAQDRYTAVSEVIASLEKAYRLIDVLGL